jgi:hypothetical protein
MLRKSSGCMAGCLALALIVACDKSSPTEPTPTPCTYTLSTMALAIGAGGGPGSVNVTSAAQCTWTAASDRAWMSITSGANGTGNGVVNVSLTPNASSAVRTGTLTIAGLAVAVRQEAPEPCSIGISPVDAAYSKDAATGTFAVTAAAGCEWTARSSAAWLTVSSGETGTGNGTVAYALERNRATTPRTATITVGERTFTVSQAADTSAPGACSYSVSPVQFRPCMSAPYNLEATIATQQGCTWTAAPGPSWISVVDGRSGRGSGVIRFRVSDNWDAPRQGIVMVRWPTPTAGQNLQVSQAGCLYAVSTPGINIVAGGGSGRFDVLQVSDPNSCGGPLQNACRWSAQANVSWITITTSMPQVGDNPVSFTVAPNTSAAARTGRITVKDKVVQVTQAGL